MVNQKSSGGRIRGSEILVAVTTKNQFKEYCKQQKVDMQHAANEILLFIVKNKISLSDLDNMMDKNITKEILRYHNYTVGFLKEFEKRQIELMKKLIGIIEGEGAGESLILKTFMQEILKDMQFSMLQNAEIKEGQGIIYSKVNSGQSIVYSEVNPDVKIVRNLIDENDVIIKKTLDDNKNR